jgi:hypothetical protein
MRTEERDPFLAAGGFQFIEAEVSGNPVDPCCKFSLRLVAFGSLPDPQKDFLGQVFGLCSVSNKTINEIQNGSLMAIYKGFKCFIITFGVSGNAKITPYGKRKFIPLIRKGGRNGARKGILTPDGIIGRRSHDQTGEVV